MNYISECINEIGNSGSLLFMTIDFTAGFWQMLLKPKSRPYTAFTVPGKGQFQWVMTPMGLLGAPASCSCQFPTAHGKGGARHPQLTGVH